MERANGKLQALRALWQETRGARPIPSRGDMPVSALRPWLGHLALIDLTGATPYFRLCGTGLHARFGIAEFVIDTPTALTSRRLASLTLLAGERRRRRTVNIFRAANFSGFLGGDPIDNLDIDLNEVRQTLRRHGMLNVLAQFVDRQSLPRQRGGAQQKLVDPSLQELMFG